MRPARLLLVLPFAFLVAAACGDDAETANSVTSGAGAGGVGGGGSGGANAGGSGGANAGGQGGTGAGIPPPPTTTSECQTHIYECGDLVDNDGDGLLDYQDPDCLGPCDNTEAGYFGGIPGQEGPPCNTDCYFDQDSGSGNDDCYWNHACDPNSVDPNYYPETYNGAACAYDPNANTPGTSGSCDDLYAAQSDTCYSYCGPLTPNGCDCFGCCELPAGSGSYVWLGSDDDGDQSNGGTCDIASVADPSKCAPCLPVAACLNGCDTCELCIGKTELPPECFEGGTGGGGGAGGGGQQCNDGVQPCGLEGQDPCADGFYCITGCCIEQPD